LAPRAPRNAKAVVGVGEPVAALGVFALVDDIEAGVALHLDDVGDRRLSLSSKPAFRRVEARMTGQAAHMRRQNLAAASLHGPFPNSFEVAKCAPSTSALSFSQTTFSLTSVR